MPKYTKKDMIKSFVSKGMTEIKAIELVTFILEEIESNLLKGNKVVLSGIGTITPEELKDRTKILFGEEVKLEKKIKLTLNTSRVLTKKYRAGDKVSSCDLKKVGDLILQNSKK